MGPADLPNLIARRRYNGFALTLWLGFSISLVFLLANTDRGFEITDEGLALLAASHPGDVRIAPTGFAYSTSILYGLAGGGPSQFRRLGILTLVAASMTLAWGLTFSVRSLELISALPLAGLGALVFMDPGLTMPSYNLVSTSGLLAGMGFFLASGGESRAPSSRAWAVLCGVCFGLAGLAKPPGVALTAVAVVLGMRGERSLRFGLTAFGVLLAVGQHLARQGPTIAVQMFRDGVEFNQLLGYSGSSLTVQYLRDGFHLVQTTLKMALAGLIAIMVSRWTGRFERQVQGFLAPALLLSSIAIFGGLSGGHRTAADGRSASALLGTLALLFVSVLSSGDVGTPGRRRDLTLVAALFLAPFLSIFGTNTPVGFAILFSCAPWLLIPSVIDPSGRSGSRASAVVLALLVTAWTLSGPNAGPYRRAPLDQQTVLVEVGEDGSHLRVDPRTARFINSYREAATTCGFHPGDSILSFSWTPGLVWALGGRSPVITHFVHGFFAGAKKANEFALSRIPSATQEKAFIIHTTRGASVHPSLVLGRQNFPKDYRLCFEAKWPANDDVVRLYAPPR